MIRKLLPFSFILIVSFSFARVTETNTSVQFNSNEHELTPQAIQTLNNFIAAVQKEFDYEITLEGHTDNIGNLSYNDQLSSLRTSEVRQYLIDHGIVADLITTSDFGERKPEKPNNNELNKSKNRRVELSLKVIAFIDIQDLNNALMKDRITTITIDPTQETVVEGRFGSKILVQKNSFIDSKGQVVNEEVKIKLTEAIEFQDFIMHNLATVSDGQMLVSGGMIKLEARTESGEQVQILEGKSLTIAIPSKDIQEGMLLFTSDQGDNWTSTNQPVSNQLMMDNKPYPYMNYRAIPLPVFKRDMDSKPIMLIKANKPREPKEPIYSDFETEIKWHQYLWKNSIERKSQQSYQYAMEKYVRRLDQYEFLLHNFETKYKNYVEVKENYEQDYFCWDEQQVEDSIAFCSLPQYLYAVEENERIKQLAMAKHKISMEEWEVERRKNYGAMADKMEAMGLSNDQLVKNYITTMTELSWINIDKFYKMEPEFSRAVSLSDPDGDPAKVFLVFSDLNSMLNLERHDNNTYSMTQFPKNETAHILAYKVVDGKTMVYYQPLQEKEAYEINYKPYKLKELRALLERLNA